MKKKGKSLDQKGEYRVRKRGEDCRIADIKMNQESWKMFVENWPTLISLFPSPKPLHHLQGHAWQPPALWRLWHQLVEGWCAGCHWEQPAPSFVPPCVTLVAAYCICPAGHPAWRTVQAEFEPLCMAGCPMQGTCSDPWLCDPASAPVFSYSSSSVENPSIVQICTCKEKKDGILADLYYWLSLDS